MSLMRGIFTRSFYIAGGISIAIGSFYGLAHLLLVHIAYNQCDFLQESLASPDKSWILERYRSGCAEAEWQTISLRRPSDKPGVLQNVIFVGASPDQPGLKWIDNKKLLVAFRKAVNHQLQKRKFSDIEIDYAIYPLDPSSLRDQQSANVILRPSVFDLKFREHEAAGQPGVDCELWLSTSSGIGSDTLKLRFSGSRIYAVGGSPRFPEHITFSVLFAYDTDYTHVLPFITAVSLDGILSPAAAPTAFFDRNFRPIIAPAGNISSEWQTQWRVDYTQFMKFIQSIKNDQVDIALAYWLENSSYRYTSLDIKGQLAIDQLKRCLTENSIR